jgi:ankyrin repeat protein
MTGELLQACVNYNLDKVKNILETPQVIDFKTTNSKGKNMLHLVLNNGKVDTDENRMKRITDIVKLLCKNHVDWEAQDDTGLRPLHYCAKTMNIDAASYLIKNCRANVNGMDKENRTALYHLALDCNPDPNMATELLKHDATTGNKDLPPLQARARLSQKKVRDLIKAKNHRRQ